MSVPNTGPLLWHFEENSTSDPSIELDLEEVKTLAGHIGFEVKVGTSISVAHFSS
jgi:carnosine N-methyltransferase